MISALSGCLGPRTAAIATAAAAVAPAPSIAGVCRFAAWAVGGEVAGRVAALAFGG
jgi:hypothetical protein